MLRRREIGRRATLLGGLGLLGGCGFRPLFAPGTGGVDSAVARELAAVEVPVMAERSGQLMRQALQDRLERFNLSVAKKYELVASYQFIGLAEAIQPTTDPSRVRFTGVTNWSLHSGAVTGPLVANGTAKAMDGLDVIVGQFFEQSLQSDVVMRRLADTLADQVVMQLASYFASKTPPQGT